MAVIVDCDCDGYTSSAIFINYLYALFPTYVENNVSYFVHDSKQHGLYVQIQVVMTMIIIKSLKKLVLKS